jgi:glycosyltransferase involved in cell wall biosynthesis
VKAKVLPIGKCKILGRGASNGVNLNVFNPARFNEADQLALRKQFQLGANHKILLFVGRMVSEKGIEELVNAFCKFYENHKDYRLVLIGPYEPERDSISAAIISRIDSHEAILHLHWSTDIPLWMYMAKALVLPSYREGFANVLLEAAAMRCLLMVSAIDGNLNLVPDETCGILFAPQSTEALYNAMLGLHSLTESDYTERATKPFKVVQAHYSQEQVHAHLATAYYRLLQEKNLIPNLSCSC